MYKDITFGLNVYISVSLSLMCASQTNMSHLFIQCKLFSTNNDGKMVNQKWYLC